MIQLNSKTISISPITFDLKDAGLYETVQALTLPKEYDDLLFYEIEYIYCSLLMDIANSKNKTKHRVFQNKPGTAPDEFRLKPIKRIDNFKSIMENFTYVTKDRNTPGVELSDVQILAVMKIIDKLNLHPKVYILGPDGPIVGTNNVIRFIKEML